MGRTVERARMLVEDPTVERLRVGVTTPLLLIEDRGCLEVVLGIVVMEPLERFEGRTCGRVVVGLDCT